MPDVTVVYPPTPKNIDPRITQPSASFRREVMKVLTAILFFIAVYITLVIAAVALAALCGWGGIALVIAWPKAFTIMIGLGLAWLGIMVIFFLLKFLFKSHTVDRSHVIEITAEEQPELFQFIRTLTKELQTPFPKKVYLSPEVNACVFYDSSFWSMFFPIRKNLQIGMGFVNCVNISEFKAILAHEFGHFSQRSMKLGSYVYNVNQVIYNMLHDNEDYKDSLENWGNVSGYFYFFAAITMVFVRGIQLILRQVYTIVNKSYMSLSREMEFHADAVAASVSGSGNLSTSLRRLELADTCYAKLFDHYYSWIAENLRPDNLYPQHREIMKRFAEDHQVTLVNGLPQVSSTSFARFNKSRVVVKDQWASHPSTDDREEQLTRLNVQAETIHDSAWIVFRNAEALQAQLTDFVYREATFKREPVKLDLASFQTRFNAETKRYVLDAAYNGFYDDRQIERFEFTPLTTQAQSLGEVFTDEVSQLPYVITGLNSDIQILTQIQKLSGRIKTFEFNGEKYSYDDAFIPLNRLREELKTSEERIKLVDQEMYAFFSQRAEAGGLGDTIRTKYEQMFAVVAETEEDMKKFIELYNLSRRAFYGASTIHEAMTLTLQVVEKEWPMKHRLRLLLSDPLCNELIDDKVRKDLEAFVASNHKYISQSNFLDSQLTLFNTALMAYQQIATSRNFKVKKELLSWQLQLI